MFGRRKKSALDKRIDSLVAEMAAVERDMRSLSRAESRGERGAAVRSPVKAPVARPAAPAPEAAPAAREAVEPAATAEVVRPVVSAVPRAGRPDAVRFPSPAVGTSPARPARAEPRERPVETGPAADAGAPVTGSAPTGRDGLRRPKTAADLRDIRFVSYLVDRGFQSPPRPMRSERRVEKDKALVMTIFVALVLLWVLFRCFW